jgi:flagellar basal-body rod modification protein FlgD
MSASIINPLASTPPAAPPAASTPSASSLSSLASPDVFLQLLVAQLKYQDPESPADGTEFVTQLAQFSEVGQSTQMVSDLDAIKALLAAQSSTTPTPAGPTAAPTTPPAGTATSPTAPTTQS